MKTKFNCLRIAAVWVVLLSTLVMAVAGPEPTALQLAREGNRFVGEPSKGRVLEIVSDKSIASITPTIWRVAYFDPDARSRIVEVKFGSGLKMDVTRPLKIFGSHGKEGEVLDLKKLKVDSDEALRIAAAQKLLQPFTLKYSQLWLRRGADGLAWKVRLWAAKLGKPDVIMEIGDLFLSPVDGQVVRVDLHIERLN